MVIFGGSGAHSPLGDLWAFELSTMRWFDLSILTPRSAYNTEDSPSPRHAHCTAIKGDLMLLFGGIHGTNSGLGDLWALGLAPVRKVIEKASQGVPIFGVREISQEGRSAGVDHADKSAAVVEVFSGEQLQRDVERISVRLGAVESSVDTNVENLRTQSTQLQERIHLEREIRLQHHNDARQQWNQQNSSNEAFRRDILGLEMTHRDMRGELDEVMTEAGLKYASLQTLQQSHNALAEKHELFSENTNDEIRRLNNNIEKLRIEFTRFRSDIRDDIKSKVSGLSSRISVLENAQGGLLRNVKRIDGLDRCVSSLNSRINDLSVQQQKTDDATKKVQHEVISVNQSLSGTQTTIRAEAMGRIMGLRELKKEVYGLQENLEKSVNDRLIQMGSGISTVIDGIYKKMNANSAAIRTEASARIHGVRRVCDVKDTVSTGEFGVVVSNVEQIEHKLQKLERSQKYTAEALRAENAGRISAMNRIEPETMKCVEFNRNIVKVIEDEQSDYRMKFEALKKDLSSTKSALRIEAGARIGSTRVNHENLLNGLEDLKELRSSLDERMAKIPVRTEFGTEEDDVLTDAETPDVLVNDTATPMTPSTDVRTDMNTFVTPQIGEPAKSMNATEPEEKQE